MIVQANTLFFFGQFRILMFDGKFDIKEKLKKKKHKAKLKKKLKKTNIKQNSRNTNVFFLSFALCLFLVMLFKITHINNLYLV